MPKKLTPQQKSFVIWLTGLSGAGKSILAQAVNDILITQHKKTHLLDGDIVRKNLCADLTFSDADRTENISRVSKLAKTLIDDGSIVLAALISPKHHHRQLVRDQFKLGEFIEVYVDTAFEVCEKRDVKGLYKKARKGELINFTGIDSSYEVPMSPEIHIKTENKSIDACVNQVMTYLLAHDYIDDDVSLIS